MKRYLAYALLLASLSIPALAAKHSQNITLSQPMKVGTTQLPAGNYKVSWTGTAPSVQVTIAQGKNTVTVPAKLVETKNDHVAVTTDTVDGATVLQSIELSDLTLAIAGE